MKGNLIGLCLLFILALVGYSLTNTPATATNSELSSVWSITTIDDVDSGFYVHHSYTSIVVDNEDHVHISYRGPNYDLRYATNKTSGWMTEVVYDVFQNIARENSLAVDPHNHPHISFSYSDGGAEDLKYAKNITGTWVITTVDSPGSVGMENDIAIDSHDNIHMSHWQWNGNKLRYSTNKSGEWVTEVIADATWDRTSIAIDSNDKVHLVFRGLNNIFTYTTNLNGAWEMTTIDTCGGEDCDPAVAVDENNKIHISYTCGSDLKYATNISGSWEITTIAGGVNAGRYHSIAIDNNGKVHLSFYDSSEGDLKYANNVTSSWSTYTVDSEGDVGRSNAIAIDSLGYVHISYRYDTQFSAKLRYATNAPAELSYPVYLPLIMRHS